MIGLVFCSYNCELCGDMSRRLISPLYKAIDSLNMCYGKGKVFSAAEGVGEKTWKMKCGKLSKRAITRWNELMTVI